MKLENSNFSLGARLSGVDLRCVNSEEFAVIERALYTRGALAISDQSLTPAQMKAFCARVGPLHRNETSPYIDPVHAEIMILSNMRLHDKPLGAVDAGQDWHTDMAYNQLPGKATALHGVEVPMRDGQALGDTQFSDMHAAFAALPADVKHDIDGAWAIHDFSKYYDAARRKNGMRPELTAEQRAKRPPARHPLVGRHPYTGLPFLYANPGYIIGIEGMDARKSEELLNFLYAFQTRPEFVYRNRWRKGDVLIWDNLATIHKASSDYAAHESRYMLRAQIGSVAQFEAYHVGGMQ
jgi:taurine dioxygenase